MDINSAPQVYTNTIYFMSVIMKGVDGDPLSPFVFIQEPEIYFSQWFQGSEEARELQVRRWTAHLFHVTDGFTKVILSPFCGCTRRSWSPFIWLLCQRCVMPKDFSYGILRKVPLSVSLDPRKSPEVDGALVARPPQKMVQCWDSCSKFGALCCSHRELWCWDSAVAESHCLGGWGTMST